MDVLARVSTESARRTQARWRVGLAEAASLAWESLRTNKLRSALAIGGVVIGIITVVLVATVLVGVRNGVAGLFRELGTENVFALHRQGDPYSPASDKDAQRKPLEPWFATYIAAQSTAIRDVAVEVIVPPIVNGRPIVVRAGGNDSDTALLEGASPNFFDITGTEFRAGRPFTDVENASGARVAVIGSNVAKALFGVGTSIGRPMTVAGDTYYVVGECAPRRGSFFGENRNDNVISIPASVVARRFPESKVTVLYARSKPGQLALARDEMQFLLRRLRRLGPADPDDFNLSTAEQIIQNFDQIGAQIGLATIALAGVSLIIGGIGIANVMIISVTERTREIGTRIALGARRKDVLRQFLLEAALLSGLGGALGVGVSSAIGLVLSLWKPAFPAMPPGWAVAGGLVSSIVTGVVAGYLPARRAAGLDPVDALRYE